VSFSVEFVYTIRLHVWDRYNRYNVNDFDTNNIIHSSNVCIRYAVTFNEFKPTTFFTFNWSWVFTNSCCHFTLVLIIMRWYTYLCSKHSTALRDYPNHLAWLHLATHAYYLWLCVGLQTSEKHSIALQVTPQTPEVQSFRLCGQRWGTSRRQPAEMFGITTCSAPQLWVPAVLTAAWTDWRSKYLMNC
jgi:hypothetical protein